MSSNLMALLGVLVIVVGVAASIALHEIGHLVPAKRFGVKCTQYMVGFGHTVWSFRRGETEYGFKALPLGGYVRMLGMFPPKNGQPARADTTGRLGLLIEQARHDAAREVTPQDSDRLFYQRSVPKRLVIMLGGPVMNLVLGTVLLTIVVTMFGVPSLVPTVSTVSECVLPADAPVDRTCSVTDEAAPANAAGVKPGDEILSVAGVTATTWDSVRNVIRVNGGKQVPIVVRRGEETLTLAITPIVAERPKTLDGQEVLDAQGRPETEKVGFLGVSPTQELVPQSVTLVPGMLADS